MQLHQRTAAQLGFANLRPSSSGPWRSGSRAFVERGGFLFAMCTATETA